MPDLPTPPVPGELLHPEEPQEDENGKNKGARRKEMGRRPLLLIPSTDEASLRFDVSSTAAAAICNGFLVQSFAPFISLADVTCRTSWKLLFAA